MIGEEVRAYRGIHKWYAWDMDFDLENLLHPETLSLYFDKTLDFEQYKTLAIECSQNDLVGIAALITYLNRYQPLKEGKTRKLFRIHDAMEDIWNDLRKAHPRKDSNICRWFLEDDMQKYLDERDYSRNDKKNLCTYGKKD